VSITRPHLGLGIVAAFEAAKGLLVLMAGFGLLSLVHHDAQRVAEDVVRHFHLDPASHYPGIFLDLSSRASDTRLWLLAALAFCYAGLRLAEAYGLWRERPWAEWFAVASGGIYVPIEIYELFSGVSRIKAGMLAINVGIVVYMIKALRERRQRVRI
jgi:uncharacterized membrane protein (DUF2068 family)